MELIIALEHRFSRTPDGAIWTPTALARPSWDRYFGNFRRVRLLARVKDVPVRNSRWKRVDGDGVDLLPVPCYVGPREFLTRFRQVRKAVVEALARSPRAAVILRVPGTMGTLAAANLRAVHRPFAIEVVGDPYDVFAPGASDHLLRPVFRQWTTRKLRQICWEASTALYVTREALQRRYPTRPGVRAFAASDVEAEEEAFVTKPRNAGASVGSPFRIVHVGTLAALYKGPDRLLDAAARCRDAGLAFELAIIGDGRLRGSLERQARRLRLASCVRFIGQLASGAAVREELDRAHLFVLPSRQEGMPRALIEAMARSLPCLATAVGGIPEVLSADALVPPDADALAIRILELARNPALCADLSRRNLARARDFHQRALQPIREQFFAHVVAQVQGAAPTQKAIMG